MKDSVTAILRAAFVSLSVITTHGVDAARPQSNGTPNASPARTSPNILWISLEHITPDEFGYHVTENAVHVRDLHATILHLLRIDHQRLSVAVQGLDMRLTGVVTQLRV
ncbi:MAG: DUF1501 domain-containing protein [Fuerstiella sp.]|nr:DUF1501 domain-containing protein [Fuerstiella sp.]MCP4853805.1 DUF1501 domain-containing protein [Fuerstiella sp.]